jgi:PKD repeat protein
MRRSKYRSKIFGLFGIRTRQTLVNQQIEPVKTPRQENQEIIDNKDKIPELINVPQTSFIPNTAGDGIFNVGLLAPRTNIPVQYTSDVVSSKNIPIVSSPPTYDYFFIKYDNLNVNRRLDSIMKSFSVVKTLNPSTIKDVAEMLRLNYTNITPLTKSQYDNDSFSHPKYVNDSGEPLQIRYAEISIISQRTPGRLDNIPLGYPDFDSTPDGVITSLGPIPRPPYTDFTSATGATFSVQIVPGSTLDFKDASVKTPWQFAPTGWNWYFGPSASPTGSTAQNPSVFYSGTGNYTVELTASNKTGSTGKTKINFVIVTN